MVFYVVRPSAEPSASSCELLDLIRIQFGLGILKFYPQLSWESEPWGPIISFLR